MKLNSTMCLKMLDIKKIPLFFLQHFTLRTPLSTLVIYIYKLPMCVEKTMYNMALSRRTQRKML